LLPINEYGATFKKNMNLDAFTVEGGDSLQISLDAVMRLEAYDII